MGTTYEFFNPADVFSFDLFYSDLEFAGGDVDDDDD